MRATGKHSVPPSWRTTHGGGAQNETAAPLGTAVSPLVRLTGLLATPSSASWMPRPLNPSSAIRPAPAAPSPPSGQLGTTLCSRNRRVRATRIPRVAEARSHRSAFARGRPREPSRTGGQTSAQLPLCPLVRPRVCTSRVAESRTSQKRWAFLLPPFESEACANRLPAPHSAEEAAPAPPRCHRLANALVLPIRGKRTRRRGRATEAVSTQGSDGSSTRATIPTRGRAARQVGLSAPAGRRDSRGWLETIF